VPTRQPRARILTLEANPLNLASLRTTTELKNLKNLLEPQGFEVEFGLATRPDEVQSLLRQHTPDILHFAGHGDSDGELYAEDEAGNAVAISMEALAEAVSTLNRETNGKLRLIVLNACYGARQAGATGPSCRVCHRRPRVDPRR
jgi:CHAT domain-containing protein